MKNKDTIPVIDLTFQVDLMTPKRIHLMKNVEPIPLMQDCLLY